MKTFKALNNGMSVVVDDNDNIRMIGYTNGNRVDVTFKSGKDREIYVDYRHIKNGLGMSLANHMNFDGICEMYQTMIELYYTQYKK